MEKFTHSKPTRLSAYKSLLQAHGVIARSFSPLLMRAERALESANTNAGRSLPAISGSWVCTSSTSAVINAQEPAYHRLITAEEVASGPAQKEVPKKSKVLKHLRRGKVDFAAAGYLPAVEHTWDPCKAFYESMLEMVTVCGVDVYDGNDLEEMFAYYLVLNSSHHHPQIKEAFAILLTHLYHTKLLTQSAPHRLH